MKLLFGFIGLVVCRVCVIDSMLLCVSMVSFGVLVVFEVVDRMVRFEVLLVLICVLKLLSVFFLFFVLMLGKLCSMFLL